MQCGRYGGVNGAYLSGRLGECASEDENPEHQQHVLMSRATGKYGYLVFDGCFFAYQECVCGCYQECCRDGNLIEVLRYE